MAREKVFVPGTPNGDGKLTNPCPKLNKDDPNRRIEFDRIVEEAEMPAYDFNIHIVPNIDGIAGIAFYHLNEAVVGDYAVPDIERLIAHELGHLLGRAGHNVRNSTVMHEGATGDVFDKVDWDLVYP